jgi:hypothetical protein
MRPGDLTQESGAALLDRLRRCGVCPKRTVVVACYTDPPVNATTLSLDEFGPVSPRTCAPAPGRSVNGHRINAQLEYCREPETVWGCGAWSVPDGGAVTLMAGARNTAGYLELLAAVAVANPTGDLYLITGTLASRESPPIQTWPAEPPRVQQVFVPTGACWLNLQVWW